MAEPSRKPYQERIAQDRQQEREQFRASQRQLQDQLQMQTHQVVQLEARTAQLQRVNVELRSKVNEQKLSEQINQIDQANFKADILRLNEELAAKLRENQNYFIHVVCLPTLIATVDPLKSR